VLKALTSKELEYVSQDESGRRVVKKKVAKVPIIQARMMKLKPITALKAIKSSLLGKDCELGGNYFWTLKFPYLNIFVFIFQLFSLELSFYGS